MAMIMIVVIVVVLNVLKLQCERLAMNHEKNAKVASSIHTWNMITLLVTGSLFIVSPITARNVNNINHNDGNVE